MAQRHFLIKPNSEELKRYAVVLTYYKSLNHDVAKAKFLNAAWAFWEASRVWEDSQDVQSAKYTASLCRQKIAMQQQEIRYHFGLKTEEEGNPNYPKIAQAEQWQMRFQPKTTSPNGIFLDYLVLKAYHLTSSEKYWIPSEAYWGAYGAQALNLPREETLAMVDYCLETLEKQREFLRETFLEGLTSPMVAPLSLPYLSQEGEQLNELDKEKEEQAERERQEQEMEEQEFKLNCFSDWGE